MKVKDIDLLSNFATRFARMTLGMEKIKTCMNNDVTM